MMIGYQQYRIDVPLSLSQTMKNALGRHFHEKSKCVNCPAGFTTDSSEHIFAEYSVASEHLVKSGVQALILNFIRSFKPSEIRVSLLDYIHYNSDIVGPLSAFSGGNESLIEVAEGGEDAIKKHLSYLSDVYRKIERVIGTKSVFEYNKGCSPDKKIPLRILLLNKPAKTNADSGNSDADYLINNAHRFGLFVIHLYRIPERNDNNRRRLVLQDVSGDCIRITADSSGELMIQDGPEWRPFAWLTSSDSLPGRFVEKVKKEILPVRKGTYYFDRYSMTLPKKSSGKRKPISVPFSVDSNDNPVSCTFENNNFAAFIMGAAGSGKSTLLHTIIAGLLLNYHPDEVELWLLDFKMMEFKQYVNCRPPHVKYLLLEKSEDLVFDILDLLTEELNRRQYLFSQNQWFKLSDVPVEKNIPAIFVIIDEFAQMSQIIKETRGNGSDGDYALKLENLLAKGRAVGMKFIFASQTYTTGITGLTDTACKQIQLRFALKNTSDEIRQTLMLNSSMISESLNRDISELPPYETIYKWRDEAGNSKVERLRNMYVKSEDIKSLTKKINSALRPVPKGRTTDNSTYIEKNPVMIIGDSPKAFRDQLPYYKQYEDGLNREEYDESDVFIYPGVPCSFTLARPFLLSVASAENILMAGGGRDEKVSILLSVINSCYRAGVTVKIWSHSRFSIYRKYKGFVLARFAITTDPGEICGAISSLKSQIAQRKDMERQLIIILGCDQMADDWELMGDESTMNMRRSVNTAAAKPTHPSMEQLMAMVKKASDPEEKRRIINEYNNQYATQQSVPSETIPDNGIIYNAREDLLWLLKRSSNSGVHFLFCFDKAHDFIQMKLDGRLFRHKILLNMSRDESITIAGNRSASEISSGEFIYSDGRVKHTLRPHIYRNVPCNGWLMDDSGVIVPFKP